MVRPILAIDPGASGGIAYLHSPLADAQAACMPRERAGIVSMFTHFATVKPVVVMELVGGYVPRFGGEDSDGEEVKRGGQPGSHMFKFGRGFGFLEGLIAAYEITPKLYTPQTWQRGLGLEKRNGRSDSAWKGYLADVAREKFPHVKVTLKTADALLILDYAVRMSNVDPGFYR